MKGLSFWNSGFSQQSAAVAILFNENFEGKIQTTSQDKIGRIISTSFTLQKQNFQVVNIYGPNKTYQREQFFQSLTTYINSNQNTILGGDFDMVTDLTDRNVGHICNTHLVGSLSLNHLLTTRKLSDTWRKKHPSKLEYTYHRPQSNIHSTLNRIYASYNLKIFNSTILPFQYSDHDTLITEFILGSGTRGPGYWKLNTSILQHENFNVANNEFLVQMAKPKRILQKHPYLVGNRKTLF